MKHDSRMLPRSLYDITAEPVLSPRVAQERSLSEPMPEPLAPSLFARRFVSEGNEGRFRCVDCGALSPDTSLDEASASLTIKFGWRLRRRVDDQGRATVEPRCATCHARTKSAPRMATIA